MSSCILSFPHEIGIAHISRLFLISSEIEKNGFASHIAYSGSYKNFFKKFCVYNSINDVGKSFFADNELSLAEIVKNEVKLIKKVDPIVVIGDTRPSLYISSRICNKSYISICNANMTKFFPPPPTKKKEYETLSIKAAVPYNSILSKNNLKTVQNFYELFEGDITLIADDENFMPLRNLDKNFRYVGPITWESNDVLDFSGYTKNRSQNKKLIFVTGGSTGTFNTNEIMSFYKRSEYCAIKNNNKNICAISPTLRISDAMVFHGGNCTTYLAIKNGIPMIGLPSNPDQQINVNRIVETGIGVGLYPQLLKKEHLIKATEKVLDYEFKQRVLKLKNKINNWYGEKEVSKVICKFIGEPK